MYQESVHMLFDASITELVFKSFHSHHTVIWTIRDHGKIHDNTFFASSESGTDCNRNDVPLSVSFSLSTSGAHPTNASFCLIVFPMDAMVVDSWWQNFSDDWKTDKFYTNSTDNLRMSTKILNFAAVDKIPYCIRRLSLHRTKCVRK